MLGPGSFGGHVGQQTWQAKRPGRKRSMVLVDVRLLWILGIVAGCGILYAGWVNVMGMPAERTVLSTDQTWRLQSVAPLDWNYQDVDAWATSIGLRPLASSLRRNGVDGQLLLTLTENDIRKDLSISNDLQVRKVMLAIQKLRNGDNLPPSASRQGLLLHGLNSSATVLASGKNAAAQVKVAATLPSSRAGPGIRTFSLYRIWQRMSSDVPFMTIQIDASKSWDSHIESIRTTVVSREGPDAGHSPARGKKGQVCAA